MSRGAQNEPQLSLAIIVRNDLARLQRTLAAVASSVDEIVVCDGSEESGVAECVQKYGGRVVEHPWCDSFAIARNECMRHVQGQWVLWLDAGEIVDAADLKQLREQLSATSTPTAFMLLVKTPPTAGALDGEQVARVRVIPNQAGIRYVGRVRESLIESLEKLGIPIEGLPFRIHRAPDEHDAERKELRARRNVELADLELREVGPLPRLLNCLGEAFQTLGEYQQAAGYYQHTLDRAPIGSPEMLEAYYGLLTLEETSEARRESESDSESKMQLCLRALDRFPLDMQLLCAMGGYLQASGRWDLAMRSYETAYRYGQIHPEVWHMDHLRSVAAECYALSLQLQGKLAEAGDVLSAALKDDPSCQRVRRQLLEILVKQGQRDAALELVNVDWPAGDREALRSAVRGASLAATQNWIAARAYLQVAYQAGCRESLCLRWLSITLMASGATEDARQILNDWSRQEPDNPEPRRYLETLGESAAANRSTTSGGRQLRVDGSAAGESTAPITPHTHDISTPSQSTTRR